MTDSTATVRVKNERGGGERSRCQRTVDIRFLFNKGQMTGSIDIEITKNLERNQYDRRLTCPRRRQNVFQ